MFGIKPFTYCVKDAELRELWIEIAEAAKFNLALSYMNSDKLYFEIVDETWGSPEFWQMAGEMRAIAKHFDYSIEAGFLPPFGLFDFEIMSPEAQQALREEADAAFNMIERDMTTH